MTNYEKQNFLYKKADEPGLLPRYCFSAIQVVAEQSVRATPLSPLGTLVANAA
jgi:hypothetical protein